MFVNKLISSGFTNKDSEDYGVIACSNNIKLSFALCCGESHENKFNDNCSICGFSLLWQNEVESIYKHKLKRHKDSWDRKQELKEISSGNASYCLKIIDKYGINIFSMQIKKKKILKVGDTVQFSDLPLIKFTIVRKNKENIICSYPEEEEIHVFNYLRRKDNK